MSNGFNQPPGGGFGQPPGSGGFGPPPGGGYGQPPGAGGFGPPPGGPPGGGGFGAPPGGAPVGGFAPSGPTGPKTDPLAFASIGVSLASLIACFCCGAVLGIVGTGFSSIFGIAGAILGVVSIVRINKDPAALTGKPIAIAGIAVGAISVLITIVLTIVMAVGLVAMPAMQR